MIVHEVEQRSPEWYALRAGIPTASAFSKIVTSQGEPSKSAQSYALTLAAEKLVGRPVDAWEGNAWTERGKMLEEQALLHYEITQGVTVDQIGFVTDDKVTMGCSPDGLVGDDGMVETKCLKAENHIKVILHFRKYGTCLTDYVQQTQGQVMICERSWCDLNFYHPDLPSLVIRQKPDKYFQNNLLTEIKKLRAHRDAVYAVLKSEDLGDDLPPAAPLSKPELNQLQPIF